MNIRESLIWAHEQLSKKHIETASLDVEVLLAFVMQKNREYLYTYPDLELTGNQMKSFKKDIQERSKLVPIAYITGHKEFYGMDFLVTPDTLIPRPDTETLVETVITSLKNKWKKYIHILEIGTGSGCIGIALAQHMPDITLTVSDVSKKALHVARMNAKKHNVNISFVQSDLFEGLKNKTFDVIVSNPPYLTKIQSHKQSLQYEPQVALTPVDMTPKQFFHVFLKQAVHHLNPGGRIYMEMGHNHARVIKPIVRKHFPQSTIKFYKDLGGYERVMEIVTKE